MNKSLKDALGPRSAPTWRGHLLAKAYRFNGIFDYDDGDKEEQADMIDVDTAAITPIVDYLRLLRGDRSFLGYRWG